MKSCPLCAVPLQPEDYDEVRIWRCPQCHGVCLDPTKLELIRHRHRRDEPSLLAEARGEVHGDTSPRIHCPRCHLKMIKKPVAPRFSSMQMDECPSCGALWLDGGELAVMQLVYQASTRARDALEFQKRMEELDRSPERKARFDAAMASLPEDFPRERSSDDYFILNTIINLLRW